MRYESHRHRRRGGRNVRCLKLRRVKPDAQIVVYERGGFLSYGACGLPYYVGGFNDDPAKLIARTQAVYKEMRIETHLFHEVTRVDPERKTVTVRNLDTGAVFEDDYDVLMVATGCNSVNPKIPGADSPAVFYLKTMEDGLLLHEIPPPALTSPAWPWSAADISGWRWPRRCCI